MKVRQKLLSVGVLFFLGGVVSAQKTPKPKKDTLKDLEGVVVLGYVKKRANEFTGDAVQLTNKQINSPTAITVDQALQGRTPGVQVNSSSGTPGSVQSIRIRGVGSLTASTDPLFVIDGIPVNNRDVSDNTTDNSSPISTFSTLASLNNEDIESVTVLKDASATAAYGARGSNGVIIITTKKGKKGLTQYNFSSNIGFQNDAFVKRQSLNGAQRLQLLGEALYNQYGSQYGFGRDQGIQFAKDRNIGNINAWDGKEYDWGSLISIKNAPTYSLNFNATSGDDKSTLYASLGYNSTSATVVGADFKRITGMVRYTRKLSDKVDLETSVNGSWATQNPILERGSYYGNPYMAKILLTPWASPYNNDGSYNITGFKDFTSLFNPLYISQANILRSTNMRGISNTKIDWRIIKNLTYSTRVGVDFLLYDYKSYNNRYMSDGSDYNGDTQRSMTYEYNFVNQHSLNYVYRFNKHKFDITGLFEYQKDQKNYLNGYGKNIPADGLTNIESASTGYSASSNYTDWYNVSYLGMFNYNYNNLLLIDATYRREGSSKFASGHRFGNFWSIGGAINLERYILPTFFNTLRLRSSYGLTGNSGINVNTYQLTLRYDNNYNGNGAGYPNNFGNTNLTWEKNHTWDTGIDFSILNRRVSGSIAYFDKKTYDLLQEVPLSLTTGFEKQNQNIGTLSNRGVEAALNVNVIKTEDFTWDINANIATLKNKVIDLALDGNGKQINPSAGSSYKNTIIGEPIGYWYMRTWAGVDPQTGNPLWYVNGVNGATTSNYNEAARVKQGSAIPTYTGGFGTNLSYKGLFLNVLFYFSGGNKVYEQFSQFYMRTNAFTLADNNGDVELLNRWQNPGDITNVPKLTYSGNNNFHNTSSRWLFDDTYIRLKDVTLGYNLNGEYLKQIGINGLTFTLRGTNLWTWVKDKGLKLDPETSITGYTQLTTPPVKSIIFGVNVKF